ncbi:Protein CBR-PTL-1 [Caenorhabditis briggsae]|uniref:Microtubule-associated protein n=3 Tax=Caenorhabditis briggsae TaxID=6238 RepID=A8XLL4_CAEBR|nr:Protein CBR-PTL-1 [Caenorhabditis briggsae]ULT98405.1 hypothetical protein L3Y34_000053 [Caenorhabditis briggsae]CAP33518.2 Protein CBR-PTL-1 [Caenorhabditis briggsae]
MSTPESEFAESHNSEEDENSDPTRQDQLEQHLTTPEESEPEVPESELEREPTPVTEIQEVVESEEVTQEKEEEEEELVIVPTPQEEEEATIPSPPSEPTGKSCTPQPENSPVEEQILKQVQEEKITSPRTESQSPIPDPPIMDDIASSELESLKFSESEMSPTERHNRIMQNNENETVEDKKQISPVPVAQKTPVRSGIRPPNVVLRQPKPPAPTASIPRPSTVATSHTPRTISTPRQTASTAPSPRPISKMSRERSDVQKSTSTRSIDNVGKFTPKVNAKFVNVKSKVGSVTNHKAGGGNVEIFSEKRQYVAQSKVGSMKNANHVAGGGNVHIENRRLDFSYASPKVGSKTNYQPAKSDVKIVSEKLNWDAKSKVGSMDNAAHKPTGGNVQILSQKLNWKAESKVGSKDNMNHRPGGGNVKIFDEKIRYVSTDNSRNHSTIDISSL